jgi:hydrogenase maturation protein HypF
VGLLLEGLALQAPPPQVAPMPLLPAAGLALGWLDWQPLLHNLLNAGVAPQEGAACIHASLAAGLASAAAEAAGRLSATTVLLAGGCFQNRLLLELTATALRGAGLVPRWAEQLPSNDGGLALGQLWAALAELPITK